MTINHTAAFELHMNVIWMGVVHAWYVFFQKQRESVFLDSIDTILVKKRYSGGRVRKQEGWSPLFEMYDHASLSLLMESPHLLDCRLNAFSRIHPSILNELGGEKTGEKNTWAYYVDFVMKHCGSYGSIIMMNFSLVFFRRDQTVSYRIKLSIAGARSNMLGRSSPLSSFKTSFSSTEGNRLVPIVVVRRRTDAGLRLKI